MKYAVIASAVMALSITGCATNGNDDGRNNIGRDTSNVNERVDQNTRNVGDDNRNGVNDFDTRQLSNRQGDLNSADDAVNRVEDIKNVKRATVITTDNNAYVAATLDEGTKLTKGLEDKIANAVRKGDNSVDRVYVSTNPDFIDRMDGYANDIQNGNPVRGLADEFGETVRRVFPDAR
ncbi:YhcN/YlaJ family sporulation lipoprotein [Peribacillus cavernae]|uniref:YhcN/YlaJ family sporulation lipoprotein n=1 Tax=Peribacillus cavernae TaxID=1674310 RepID=A0A433HCG5_9BACI|nr:YhcN/YlaJ family sporulation lipoprotein [Peribacillus cavernae]MDQ0219699.1 YhcN/YlaJ family sporulation lipoprotein [Peribacillus cavernae]RUQ25977.1 YhcN/YlaJ family sporulation lipoprotein [Peribacillus cavernae]